MTTIAIVLSLAMSVPAAVVLVLTAVLALRPWPETPGEEGRASWRGPFGRPLPWRLPQRTAASIATATNSSAR